MAMCSFSSPWADPVYNICSLQQAVAVLVLHVTCGCWLVQHCGLTSQFSKPGGGGCSCRVHQDLGTVKSFVLMESATGKTKDN
jgi:hypothetical protein